MTSAAKAIFLSFAIMFSATKDWAIARQEVLDKYSYLDPNEDVPAPALERLVLYYDAHKSTLGNANFITVIDFTEHSAKKRMHVIDMKSGKVTSYLASHGKGSEGRSDDGYASVFSNVEGSNASSLGIYKTGEKYVGKNGNSMYLFGLETTNSNAYERAIVMHGADYVSPQTIADAGRIGRSLGCPAVVRRFIDGLIASLHGGSLILSWYEK